MSKKVTVELQLDDELYFKLVKMAKEKKTTVEKLIVKILKEYVKNHERNSGNDKPIL
jgi:predicted DNA-binding ribbon-helix-helix protein